jgi:D-alanine-D-alanine ligase
MTINIYLLYESRKDFITANRNKLPEDLVKSIKPERFLEADNGIADAILDIKKTPFKVKPFKLDGTKKWITQVNNDPMAIVWNITDGYEYFIGSNVPATCSVLKKPFVGSNSYIQILCQNKHHLKSVLTPYGVKTPVWSCVDKNAQMNGWAHFPCFVKPSSFDNSIGDTLNYPICKNVGEIDRNVTSFLSAGVKNVLIEEFMQGAEYTVCCVQGKRWFFECLEVEYGAGEEFFTSATKEVKSTYTAVTSQTDRDELVRVAALIIDAIGIDDYCRIDFRKNSSGEICFLEVNTAPFLSSAAFDHLASTNFNGRRHEMYEAVIGNAFTRKTGASRLAML